MSFTKLPRFPIELRKMWSGTEVQKWIDEHLNEPEPTITTVSATPGDIHFRPTPDRNITLFDTYGQVGRLEWNGAKMTFTGDVDQSAQIFFEAVIQKYDAVLGINDGSLDDIVEKAFWRFDARHKGYGDWMHVPMSERDAFKAELRAAIAQVVLNKDSQNG